MKIIELIEKDIEKIIEIENICFSSPKSRNSIQDELNNENYRLIGCISDNNIIGYLSYCKVYDELEISGIAVLPEYRNKGIATLLIEEMIKTDFSKAFLEVRKSNISAINLYKKFGFELINVRKDYYSNPIEDALILSKRKN